MRTTPRGRIAAPLLKSASIAAAVLMMISGGVSAAHADSGQKEAQAAVATTSGPTDLLPLPRSEAAKLATSALPLPTAASGKKVNRLDVQGFTVGSGQTAVRFTSYGLGKSHGNRSFVGVFVDAVGATVQQVEVVYSAHSAPRVWLNGIAQASTSADGQGLADSPSVRAGIKRTPCWYLYKYAQGQIAWGTLVAASGGVAALFSGPVGGAIAAAGGVQAATGGMNVWVVSLFCPASQA